MTIFDKGWLQQGGGLSFDMPKDVEHVCALSDCRKTFTGAAHAKYCCIAHQRRAAMRRYQSRVKRMAKDVS